MAIVLGTHTFDEHSTSVAEKQEEVGGRDTRSVRISGLVPAQPSLAALEAVFDAIVAAAGDGETDAALTLRPGRVLQVRRTGFKREAARDQRSGAFVLDLEARDPYEYAAAPTTAAWAVTASGATRVFTTGGNVYARPVITLVADGDVVAPEFSDGARTIAYTGVVVDGGTLVFDAAAGRVTLDGADVTPYTTGRFPRVPPGGATFTYTDDASSSHTATVTVAYNDRWW